MDYPGKKAEFAQLTASGTVTPPFATVTAKDQWLDGSGTYVCPSCDGSTRLVPKMTQCPDCRVTLVWDVPRDPRAQD